MIPISMRNALVLTALLMGSIATSAAPPNIVFIFSDDHAYQAVSAYGDGLNHTPNIDRLGTEGMLFNRCYVTNSICGPARAVIQTGKYSHLNGFYSIGNRFDGTQQIFPKLFKKAGYQTAVIGKWRLGTHMQPQGYDYFDVIPGQGHYRNPEFANDIAEMKAKLATQQSRLEVTCDERPLKDVEKEWLDNRKK